MGSSEIQIGSRSHRTVISEENSDDDDIIEEDIEIEEPCCESFHKCFCCIDIKCGMRFLTLWVWVVMCVYALLAWGFYTDYKLEPEACYAYYDPYPLRKYEKEKCV